ncbi:hypothetical protein N0V86_004749 [Didymella sp. IMI 355093]|nr:hypothetical protein N0V86_004749 [Didymella sp. IMI 355093]
MFLRLLTLFSIVGCAYALPAVVSQDTQANTSCNAPRYSQLIGSIQEIMFIQKQELQGLQTLLALSTQNSVVKAPANGTQSDFQLNQINIASIEQKAISVRERSQRLADELSSPSAMGLATIAQWQVAVMIDVQSLKGGGVRETKILEGLVGRVMATMDQTEGNLKMVGRGCRSG